MDDSVSDSQFEYITIFFVTFCLSVPNRESLTWQVCIEVRGDIWICLNDENEYDYI